MQTLAHTSSLKNTVRAYPGCWMSFRITSKETQNQLAIVDINMIPGAEPPRHVHEREDETIIIHEGTATFFVGEEIINARKGDVIFMPRGVPHHFVVTSPKASCTLIVTPGNLENFFEAITFPFDQDTIPAAQQPSKEEIEQMSGVFEKYGMSLA